MTDEATPIALSVTRYDVAPAGDSIDMVPSTDGPWILFDDVEASMASLRARAEAAEKDAARWRKALAAYEAGVVMSYDGKTGDRDGYVSLFLEAIRERDAAIDAAIAAG